MIENQTIERSEELTVERFNRTQDRIIRDFGYGDTEGAMGIAKASLKKLSEAVVHKIAKAKYERINSPDKQFCEVIRNLDPDVIALVALSTCLSGVASGAWRTALLTALGNAIAGECWAAGLLQHSNKLYARIKKAVKERHSNLKYRRQAARSIAARAGFKVKQWDHEKLIQAGGWLYSVVLETLPEIFIEVVDEANKPYLTVTAEGLEIAEAAVEQAIQQHPVFLPCVETPRDWTSLGVGGYWDDRARLRAKLVRTIHKETAGAITSALRGRTMQPHLDAVNALQRVPFKINTRVLEVVKECYERDIKVDGLPDRQDVDIPPKPRPWDEMTQDEKLLWKHQVSEVEDHNRTLKGNRLLFKQDIATAEYLAESRRFYVPTNCDWRGRMYGVPHFNFQRDDRVRALFLFADGKPLTEEGLRWLKIHTANCGDFDKISKRPLDERVAWAEANLERIIECSNHPLQSSAKSFWTAADKPFLFLAACMELAEAVKSPTPMGFMTHLPVSFDGSCSGLQHLAAMTRDEQTAGLVNLTPSACPQDVYQTVAERVMASIREEAAQLPSSQQTLPMLTLKYLEQNNPRNVVKRNVMTYSYSSKKFGMAKQQDEDLIDRLTFDVLSGKLSEHPFGKFAAKIHPKATTEAGKYLAEKIYTAIQSTVKRPEQAMVFLQKIARALAHEGKPVTWVTPSGLPWINRYHEPILKRIELWMHDRRVQVTIANGTKKEIEKDKAANGVAPNFVHALDASHLALTVNAAVAAGIRNVATVHDSFGCLAPDATEFNKIIRAQFVRMYEEHDVLAEVLDAAKRDLTVHNWKRLPERIENGSFNLRDILASPYAFS